MEYGSEVKRSVLCDGSKSASLAFVGDSFLFERSRVGSGIVTANRNFDQGRITVRAGDDEFVLEESFFGGVLGSNSRLGASSITQPGTVISPYCWIFLGTAVRGFVSEGKCVYNPKPMCFLDNGRVELS